MGKTRIRAHRKPGGARKPDPKPALAIKLSMTPASRRAFKAALAAVAVPSLDAAVARAAAHVAEAARVMTRAVRARRRAPRR